MDVVAHLRQVPEGTKGSLRSERFDVGEIARRFGGGGHKLAAGYTRPNTTPQQAKAELLDALEGRVNLGRQQITERPSPGGALLLDKPPGITSARAVSGVKRLLPKGTKVGHTGTLDPLASGLLVLLVGRATRLSRYVTLLDKSYTATARFGAVSDTLDAEGDITPLDAPMPDEDSIRAALPDLTGDIMQVPPMASALKRGGVRLHELHRRGLTVELEPRPVTVHALTLLTTDPDQSTATFDIACSSGTYVRTLLADVAQNLGSGAYLSSLRRTGVGHLSVKSAASPEALTSKTIDNHIIQTRKVVEHLPRVEVDTEGEAAVASGRRLPLSGISGSFRVEREGTLLAVYRDEVEEARPEVVLCGA